ncbi:speriolin-like protein [Rhinoderma darwinii]|uniref:speriolin-like protein n=1 Tax=Rhinoderma darwinii TaxID=43563 RepID=UPI003F665860
MSSAASGSFGNKTTDIMKTNEFEVLALENTCLQDENAELRKMIGLLHENLQLRFTLKDRHRRARSLSPTRKQEIASKDPQKIQQCEQFVGEIAFQLDRKILCAVFLEGRRLYGYRVADMDKKIKQVTTCALTGKVNNELRSELYLRYHHTMDQLKELGYDLTVHPYFTEYLVNTYGVMNEKTREKHYSSRDLQVLGKMIIEYMPCDKVKDILVILNCLAKLTKQDGEGMFPW